jgi:hypothetical protein
VHFVRLFIAGRSRRMSVHVVHFFSWLSLTLTLISFLVQLNIYAEENKERKTAAGKPPLST